MFTSLLFLKGFIIEKARERRESYPRQLPGVPNSLGKYHSFLLSF